MPKDRDEKLNPEAKVPPRKGQKPDKVQPQDGPDLIPVPERPHQVVGEMLRFPGAPRPADERERPAPAARRAPGRSAEKAPEKVPPRQPRSRLAPSDQGRRAPEKPPEKVIPFPEEKGPTLRQRIRRLRERADTYAEEMFEGEQEPTQDERRAQRYIPGVDEERTAPRTVRPKRREQLTAAEGFEDLPPKELTKRYNKGLSVLKLRCILIFLLLLPLFYLTLAGDFGLGLPGKLAGDPNLRCYAQAILLLAAMALGFDGLVSGLQHLVTVRVELDSIMALSCLLTLTDAILMAHSGMAAFRQPYCALAALALAFDRMGAYMKQRGQRFACRSAASSSQPYLVTVEENQWDGRDACRKWVGEPEGFGRQIQAPDGAQRLYHLLLPLVLILALVLSFAASVGRGRPENLLWCLSAVFTAGASLSSTLCYGLPWRHLARRLLRSNSALAGWDGVRQLRRGVAVLLGDRDLFPPGMVALNGMKIYEKASMEKVVDFTATVIRASGSGLTKIFDDLLRAQGGFQRQLEDFTRYKGGGFGGIIRGEQVLVGSADFMRLMEVKLPEGLNIHYAVFCAIDGELAGIFALKYTLHNAVPGALDALIQNDVPLVLTTRDFNIIPSVLSQRFKLPADRMDFPPVERRVELSQPPEHRSEVLTAVLCRGGVGPYSETVVGGKRLYRAVRSMALLACLGSLVGILLAFYLTGLEAVSALSPGNLLVFQLMWLVPTLLISNWVDRY